MPKSRFSLSVNIVEVRDTIAFLQRAYGLGQKPSKGVLSLHATFSRAARRHADMKATTARRHGLREKEEAKKMKEAGLSYRQIGLRIGVSRHTVAAWWKPGGFHHRSLEILEAAE